jgi:N-acetylglucosamine-6-phosphate deacetylase
MTTALVGARVFDGTAILEGRTVILDGERIGAVLPGEAAAAAERVDCTGRLLAPGFVDIQVNGGGGVLFNHAPTVDALKTIAAAHRRFGTTSLLPTLISDAWDTMVSAANAVAAARASGVPGILGLHFEGPYLSKELRGVHPAQHLRGLDSGFLDLASRDDLGVVVVTLAPECVVPGTIASLVSAGARVSLGHTQATHSEILAALDEGATGFTHLFNAMPPLRSREPGAVGAALSDPRGYCGVIVDGHHVDPVALQIALQARGPEKIILVTDAMSTVGSDRDGFDLFGQRVTRSSGRLTTADGTLAGSDLDMAAAVRNAVELLGLSVEEALSMASGHPAAFLGLEHEVGRVAPGFRADLVLLGDGLQSDRVWVGGQEQPP